MANLLFISIGVLYLITNIVFALPVEGGVVSLEIYDIQGRQVRTMKTPRLSGGYHKITWDGTGEAGRTLAPGTYFYRVSSGVRSETHKMQLLP